MTRPGIEPRSPEPFANLCLCNLIIFSISYYFLLSIFFEAFCIISSSSSCAISTDISLSLATRPYRPLPLAGLPGYIPYRHRAAVCIFELDVLPLLVPVKGSTGVHHLWARPYFSKCPACLVRLTLIVFVTGGRWPYSCCFVGCCLQDLFNIASTILV